MKGSGENAQRVCITLDASTSKAYKEDPLGQRMKIYEHQQKHVLDPNQFAVVRFDGRGFSKWTKNLKRPYDEHMIQVMSEVCEAACKEISGTVIGYTQSDEISIIFSALSKPNSQLYFGGQIQKIASVGASFVSGHFNKKFPDLPLAQFDARVFNLPSKVEVANYLKWRNDDCRRNAISQLASHYFSPKQLHNKSTPERRKMLEEKGIDLAQLDEKFLQGQVVHTITKVEEVEYVDRRTQEVKKSPPVERRIWQSISSPRLNADKEGFVYEQLAPLPDCKAENNES